MTDVYDISPALSPNTAVWPGDVALQRNTQMDMSRGAHLTLSSVTTTVHIGAHTDAPSHFDKNGTTIDQVDLDPYMGPCIVATCEKAGPLGPEDCEEAVRSGAKRVLFRTLSFPDPESFSTDFASFSPKAITYMGEAGVKLVGIDTPSVDPYDSKDLPAHKELLNWGLRNLEGIDLRDVPDGEYELFALPLKLVGFDAAPVRAVLRSFI